MMQFQDAIQVCLKKYSDFSGRATRAEFWWFTLFTSLVCVGLTLVSPKLGGLAQIALLLPGIAVGVRRLHDTNHSGWFILFSLIPFLNLVYLYWLIKSSDTGSNRFDTTNPIVLEK